MESWAGRDLGMRLFEDHLLYIKTQLVAKYYNSVSGHLFSHFLVKLLKGVLQLVPYQLK